MKSQHYTTVAQNHIYRHNKNSNVKYWFFGLIIFNSILLFMPWTQNIRSSGNITTIRQEQRPQELNSIIPGKVVKWFVKEGDLVNQGDTILQLSEIKDEYLDPNLINRTGEQLSAKQMSVDYYKGKAGTASSQIDALINERELKLEQTRNKLKQQERRIQSDELEFVAAQNEFAVATRQITAGQAMLDSGVISMIDFEKRKVNFQNIQSKKISAENKLANAKQEITILNIELNSIGQEFAEKISKASGDRFQSMSEVASNEGEIAKLQNQYSNYNIRSGMYYITAPQTGQVTKAKKAGIGEIVKDGEMIIEIIPDEIQYAVEIFVRPVDLPLITSGQKVQFWFDGFPAIVFSGWPNASYGTFAGKVFAVEKSVSPNGKFRVLVAEDPKEKPWPKQLRIGSGAKAMALLKDVPIWYEIWRNINGFPPDYYNPTTDK
ncbi:MAG: HlyD family efflux transporter periplasmic adaptor subunit [Chitinophagaceae bacterium]|nr:HlyD family efflux transporter periplasmic adaptor subunit [Chitinophagaceae bacterium]MBK8309850.1 HlyD family efflux transporter periplasmic adaptor subunit [Chitinophagaceae bacterium]MBP6478159.1 HlyD family efflux transporter periplasmic adaptor subunit [Chitinophagaceae bacterium]MBP7107930.1 HlyD family efflux transporter periplasmic adaptor subunit [Chitinophagaceae bacterium]MBP7314052.1 HlyD family efflux transporter periplasmic adaptor subunit [Chitinophagaceae bacterium]